MDAKDILKRLHNLEQEIAGLKSEVTPPRSWGKIFGKFGMFLVSYWALMSFFAALATATYVKFAFDIDYFESYRNASAVKRLSEFHRQMGDEMFLRSNWKQALASYKASAAANPANTVAALGIVKSSIFLPEEGQKYTDPSVSVAKLNKLRELYPDDPQVAFLQIMHAFQSGQTDDLVTKCDAVLSKFKKFPGGYLMKAYLQQGHGEFDGAITTLEALLAFDPDNGQAHSNLGYAYLLKSRTKDAMQHLELGLTQFPVMVGALSLAEACRMGGEIDRANGIVTTTERLLKEQKSDEEFFVSGQWLWNFFPEKDGDTESPKQTITCDTLEQKKAILRISQGMLAITVGDDKATNEHLAEALKLEPRYRAFVVNKLRATVYSGVVDKAVKAKMTAVANTLAE